MSFERIEDPQLDIGQRAHGQWYPFCHQALDQRRVLQAANAMIDTFDFEQVECFPNVPGRAFLSNSEYETRPLGQGAALAVGWVRPYDRTD